MLRSNPSPAELAEKTIDYAVAKKAYFEALRAEVPELMKIATGREARPPELDTFAAAFAVAGEDQEKVADQETLVMLKRFSHNPDIEKARMEFERAQKVEERFHKDFDGLDFSSWQAATSAALVLKLVKPKGTRLGADALLRRFGFQFVALKLDDLLVFVWISQLSPLRTKSHL
jgi:hypothetical protein